MKGLLPEDRHSGQAGRPYLVAEDQPGLVKSERKKLAIEWHDSMMVQSVSFEEGFTGFTATKLDLALCTKIGGQAVFAFIPWTSTEEASLITLQDYNRTISARIQRTHTIVQSAKVLL